MIEAFKLCSEYLRQNEIEKAVKIYNELNNVNQYQANLLKRMIDENSCLNEEKVKQAISQAHKSKNDYVKSLQIYLKNYRETKNIILEYYIGKMYYKLKDYKNAIFYLSKYELNGYSRLNKTYLYLYYSLIRIHGNNNLIRQYKQKLTTLNEFLEINFEIDFTYDKKRKKEAASYSDQLMIELFKINTLASEKKYSEIKNYIDSLKISAVHKTELELELVKILHCDGETEKAKNYLEYLKNNVSTFPSKSLLEAFAKQKKLINKKIKYNY